MQTTEFYWGAASTCGRRPSNEDQHVVQSISKPVSCTYAAVFDGHGGTGASEYSAANLHNTLTQQKEFPDNVPKSMQQAFNITDRNYIKQEGSADIFSSAGSTAIVCLHIGDKFFFGNAGDSRAVVGRIDVNLNFTPQSLKPITKQVSTDHKPHIPEEKQRIEQYGSCVIESNDDCSRVAGMLAVSRAIGDAPFKGCGVIATPEVFCVQQVEVDYVVLACDGLWDVMTNEEVGFVLQCVVGAFKNKQVQCSDQRLNCIKNAVALFLQSDNLQDESSKLAERELAKIGQYDYFSSESADVKAQYPTHDDKFSPQNIGRILAKTAVALGSEDNVSIVVGVRAGCYGK
ncbi:Protein_phosphatase 2C [Hexamita inflata]|uniref:Protein phosphatase 2C n=1 Tax=Hexamita inflata TaxID=28002 RepID=A0AA86QE47_9EUKA|nr:Protein phosphatase 2C [Hexamita inflata]